MINTHSPEVFIIILNWQNGPDTIECLKSVFKLKADRFQVVVCDNASSDDSIDLITDWLEEEKHSFQIIDEAMLATINQVATTDVVLIRNHHNYGYAGGNNRGLHYALTVGASDSFAWIVNNDTAFDPHALGALLAAAAERPEISYFGSTILEYDDRDIIQTQGGDRFYPLVGMSHHIGEGLTLANQLPRETVEATMSYVVGAAVFVRLAAIHKVGLFEEKYFLYFEEIDWATRADRLGLKLGYVPGSLIYHKEGATIGTSPSAGRKSELADYYGVKNRLVMTKKLFPWALPTVYLAMVVTLFKRLASGQLDRVAMVGAIMLGVDRSPIDIAQGESSNN